MIVFRRPAGANVHRRGGALSPVVTSTRAVCCVHVKRTYKFARLPAVMTWGSGLAGLHGQAPRCDNRVKGWFLVLGAGHWNVIRCGMAEAISARGASNYRRRLRGSAAADSSGRSRKHTYAHYRSCLIAVFFQ